MRTIAQETNSKIENELLEATGFVPEKRYRKRQDYLGALLKAVCDLHDSDFNKLSDPAAEWSYQAGDAYRDKTELPDFEDLQTDQALSVESVDDGQHVVPPTSPFEEDSHESLNGHADPEVDEGESTVKTQEVEPKPKSKRGRKPGTKVAKSDKEVKVKSKTRARKVGIESSKEKSEFGTLKGSVSEVVCQLMARDQGTTMNEIREVTGHYRYNVVNRLRRLGWNITKEGSVIKLHGRSESAPSEVTEHAFE